MIISITVTVVPFYLDNTCSSEVFAQICPVFESFFKFFQQDAPLVHRLFSEMLSLLLTFLKRFIKASALDGQSAKQLLKLDITSTDAQLPKADIDFELDTKREVRVSTEVFSLYF